MSTFMFPIDTLDGLELGEQPKRFQVLLNASIVENPLEYVEAYIRAFGWANSNNARLLVLIKTEEEVKDIANKFPRNVSPTIEFTYKTNPDIYDFFLNNLVTYGKYKSGTEYIARELRIAYNIYNNEKESI